MKRFNAKDNAKSNVRCSTFISVFVFTLMTLSATSSVSAAELVINGDFEQPDLTTFPDGTRAKDKGWTTFHGQNYLGLCTDDLNEVQCNDNILIPGWSAVWTDTLLDDIPTAGRVEIQNNSLVDRVNPIRVTKGKTLLAYAKSGQQKAELDSHDRRFPDGSVDMNTNVSIFQEIRVCPRAAYQLTYYWKSRTLLNNDNDVRVVANGGVVRIHSLNDSWQKETINFVTSDDTQSGIAFVSIGDGTTQGMSLDLVSLSGPAADNCPPPPVCTLDDDGSSDDGISEDGDSEDGGTTDGISEDGDSEDGLLDDGDSEDGGFAQCPADDDSSDDGSSDDGSSDDSSDDGTCGLCSGDGMASLTLLYDGNDFTLHGQSDEKSSVEPPILGLQGFPINALIKVYDDKDTLLFEGAVQIGHFFEVSKPGKALTIEIIDPATSEIVQTVKFHTSCSQPLAKYDEFGGITIWDGVSGTEDDESEDD